MGWYCCNLCRVAYADNDETPFGARDDFESLGGNRYLWNVTHESVALRVAALDRSNTNRGTLGLRLRYRLGSGLLHTERFDLFWEEGAGAISAGFIYCAADEDNDDGEAVLMCLPIDDGQSVKGLVFDLSLYPSSQSHQVLRLGVSALDDDKAVMARKEIGIPLNPARTFASLRLEGVTLTDWTRVEVSNLRSPDEPCCPAGPRDQCDTFDYRRHDLNFLSRALPMTKVSTYLTTIRAESLLSIPSVDNLLWEFALGDCCNGLRYVLGVSRGQGNNAPAYAYILSECNHGGPIVLRRQSLPLLSGADPTKPVEASFRVCLELEQTIVPGDPPQYAASNTISISTTWGTATWTNVLGYLNWGSDCAFDVGGLEAATLMAADVSWLASYTNQKTIIDQCYCACYETSPGMSECLDALCRGIPPERAGPSGWLIDVTGLPEEFAMTRWPRVPGDARQCSPVTTESTTAEGNWNTWVRGFYNYDVWPTIRQAMYDYVATHCPVPSGFKLATCSVVAGDCVWPMSYPAAIGDLLVTIFVPTSPADVFMNEGQWPVFALISAERYREVTDELGYAAICGAAAYRLVGGIVPYPFCSGTATLNTTLAQDGDTFSVYYRPGSNACQNQWPPVPNLSGVSVVLKAQ